MTDSNNQNPASNLARGLRSHYCGELTEAEVGQQVSVCGWVDRRREHGEHLAFVDLRDHTGIIQCVVDERLGVRSEYVVRITGTLRLRPDDTINPNLKTGTLEVGDCDVEILNEAETPPFSVHDEEPLPMMSELAQAPAKLTSTDETTRLRHRYIDLRRERMQRNLRTRAEVNSSLRRTMESQGFVELETPMLIASTPEGARDFVVPSRLHAGSFYALPQSPQIFKQLSMVGGIDRYYQIARCLRDEDLRADRQFEFMQLDLEASFVGQHEIVEFVTEAVLAATRVVRGDAATPAAIDTMTWHDAQERYGTDKPDLRFGLELLEVTEVFAGTDAKVFQAECIKGFSLPQGATDLSRNRIDDLTEKTKAWGAKGLAWFRVGEGLALDGVLTRFMSEDEQAKVTAMLGAQEGDMLFLIADERAKTNHILGQLRLEVGTPDESRLEFVWVVDFPLFEGLSDTGAPIPAHHPFTMPHPEDATQLAAAVGQTQDPATAKDLLQVRSLAYDLVLNGWELGSGSERISNSDQQRTIFELLGMAADEVEARFGFMINAFKYGTPPHAGFALGIDRLVSILLHEETIREVVAFPKTQSGTDPLTGAPTVISSRHLSELGISVPQPD